MPVLLFHCLNPCQIRRFLAKCHFRKSHNYWHASFVILLNFLPNFLKFFVKFINFMKLSFVQIPLFVISFVIGQTLELSIFFIIAICQAPLFVTSFEFLPNFWWILAQFPIFSICQFREIANCQYCWFALAVTAAMLVLKKKSISLLWELNSIFVSILREKRLLYWPPNMAALSRDCKPTRPLLLSHLKFSPDLWWIQIRQFRKICHFRKTHNYRHASFVILF